MKAEWSTDPGEFAEHANLPPVERFADVIDAVEQLPAKLREVINAIYWERLSAPQAIKALKISPATFFRRRAEAQRRLYKMLATDPVGEMPADLEQEEVLVSPDQGQDA